MPKTPLTPQHAGQEVHLTPSRLIQLEKQGVITSMRDSGGRRTYDPDVIAELKRTREAQRREREQRRYPPGEPQPAA